MRVAVYTRGEVGQTMGVPAIRAFYLAREFARDHDVTVVTGSLGDVRDAPFRLVSAPPDDARALTRALAPHDAVVATNLPLRTMRALARTEQNVVYDLYVPYVTEYLGLLDAHVASPLDGLFSR